MYNTIFFRKHTLGLIFIWLLSTAISAQVSNQQIEQAKSMISPQQIQQIKNDPYARKQAIQQAKAAGASDLQIQQGLQELEDKNGNEISSNNVGAIVYERTQNNQVESKLNENQHISNQKLIVFGREIFSNRNLTFAPSFNIATPKDYRLAAGDNVVINIWGASQSYENYILSPEGTIIIEGVGPVNLAGLSIQEAEVQLRSELSRIYQDLTSDQPSTYMSISLGKIRSLKVNIAGEVLTPGTYTLPSLATLFNALYMAGGVNDIGSLRNIKVYRNSKKIASLDVYDYLLHGKYDSNIRLEDNDMIVVEPYNKLVSISGKVKRARLFELKDQETLQDLVLFAGGFSGDAYTDNLRIKRKNGRMYSMFNIEKLDFMSFIMNDGDIVEVDEILNTYSNRLTIQGAIYRPGEYALNSTTRTVKQLIQKAEGTKPNAFKDRVLIQRLLDDDTQEVISFDLGKLLRGEIADIPLQREDVLTIPSIFDIRENYILTIQGAVNNPQVFAYQEKMTLEDLILQAGGLKEAASLVNVEVSRRRKDPYATLDSEFMTETFNLTVSKDLKIINSDGFLLEPFDVVNVRYSPGYQVQQSVTIDGEVIFKGDYVMAKKNERLSDLINKAGGLTPEAYIKGASLHRKMNESEKQRVQTLLKLSSQSINRKDSISVKNLNIESYIVGIDLKEALRKPGSEADITLTEGDMLYIPRYMSTVKVSGGVIYPNTVSYEKKGSVKDYLEQAGGYTDLARKRPIVIYANGKVGVTKKILFWKRYPKVEPGAEILVPMKSADAMKKRMSLAEIMSLASSTTSMAAMVTSILK